MPPPPRLLSLLPPPRLLPLPLAPISHPIGSLMTTMAWRQISARGVTATTPTILPPGPPPLVGILKDHNTGKVRDPAPPHRRVATRAPAVGRPFFFFFFFLIATSLLRAQTLFIYLSFFFAMGNT